MKYLIILLAILFLACGEDAPIMWEGGDSETIDNDTDSNTDDTVGTETVDSDDGTDGPHDTDTPSAQDSETDVQEDTSSDTTTETGTAQVDDTETESENGSTDSGTGVLDTESDSDVVLDTDTATGQGTDTTWDTGYDTDTAQDTGSGSDTETLPVDTDTVSVDTDTGIDTAQECLNGGVPLKGYCWFLGDPGDDCLETCLKNGKMIYSDIGLHYDDATETVAGSEGDYDGSNLNNCMDIMDALGIENEDFMFASSDSNKGMGCFMNYKGYRSLDTLYPTVPDAGTYVLDHQRVCACEGVIPNVAHDCAEGEGRMFYSEGSTNPINGVCWQQPPESPEYLGFEVGDSTYCENLVLGGHDDWMSSSYNQIEYLFYYRGGGCIDSYPCGDLFGDDTGRYWRYNNPGYGGVEILDFATGEYISHSFGAQLRCVRHEIWI